MPVRALSFATRPLDPIEFDIINSITPVLSGCYAYITRISSLSPNVRLRVLSPHLGTYL